MASKFCDLCGRPMKLISVKGKDPFWSCTGYRKDNPLCSGTSNFLPANEVVDRLERIEVALLAIGVAIMQNTGGKAQGMTHQELVTQIRKSMAPPEQPREEQRGGEQRGGGQRRQDAQSRRYNSEHVDLNFEGEAPNDEVPF